jgi:hypothetical protein
VCRRRRALGHRACEHQGSGPERTGPADRREPAGQDGGRGVITGSKITVSAAMRARDVSRAPEIAADDVPPAPARPPAGAPAGGRSSAKKAARRRAAAAQRASATGASPEAASREAASPEAASPEPAGMPSELARPAAGGDPAQSPLATAAVQEPAGAAGHPGADDRATDGAAATRDGPAAGPDTAPGAGRAPLTEGARSADAARPAAGQPGRSRHRSRARRRGR